MGYVLFSITTVSRKNGAPVHSRNKEETEEGEGEGEGETVEGAIRTLTASKLKLEHSVEMEIKQKFP